MADWRYFGSAPHLPSIKRRMVFDPETKTAHFQVCQTDIDEALASNVEHLNADRSSTSLWDGNGYVRVASIPLRVLEEWWAEGVRYNDENCWPEILRRLNDRKYLKLRTAPGRL